MDEASFLSKLLLVISVLALIFAFLVFPSILNNPENEINLYTLKDVWVSGNFELPIITKFTVSFADNALPRYIAFVVLLLIGILSEFFVDNKKTSGVVHTLNLTIGIMVGAFFLFSLVVPFMPL
jgi:hypothetical protein